MNAPRHHTLRNLSNMGKEGLIALASGTITYSWVQEATEVTALVAAVIGVVSAAMVAWFYFEKARAQRKENESGEAGNG